MPKADAAEGVELLRGSAVKMHALEKGGLTRERGGGVVPIMPTSGFCLTVECFVSRFPLNEGTVFSAAD